MEIVEIILGWAAGQVIYAIEATGTLGVFLLMTLESANIPIPSEIIMPFSGYIASLERFNFWSIVFAGALGNLAGSLISYWIGFKGGRPFLEKYGKYIFIHRVNLERGDYYFNRYGLKIAFWSRLVPVVRTFISLPAGINHASLRGFAFYTFLGSFIWSWLLASIGFWFGENWELVRPFFEKFSALVVGLIVLAIVVYIWQHFKNRKYKLHDS